jgi:hypothetical protein
MPLLRRYYAINLFLSGTTGLSAKFVIGLDPAVVAMALDTVYKRLHHEDLLMFGDDPSPGWAFLRKVVQLPVRPPGITDLGVEHFVQAALDLPAASLTQT